MTFASGCRGVFVPVALVFGGALWAIRPSSAEDVLVRVARAESAPVVQSIRLSGTVVPQRAAQISTDIGGLVAKMDVDIGHRVAKGAALVHLDAALEKLELERAEAATREAREKLSDTERQLAIAEELAGRGNLPKNTLDSRHSETRVVRAMVARLDAEEARQRERVRRHTIFAPFAGVVARKVTEAGEWISPGAPVVELVQTDGLRVDTAVPQQHFPDISENLKVKLEFDAFPAREVEARVVARVPVSNPTTRNFTLRLEPMADNLALTPGMSVRVTLGISTGEQGVIISRDAVMRYPDGRTTVWIIDPKGKGTAVAERHVVLGKAFEDKIYIKEGLEPGEQIVVRGNELLSPGQLVRIAGSNDG